MLSGGFHGLCIREKTGTFAARGPEQIIPVPVFAGSVARKSPRYPQSVQTDSIDTKKRRAYQQAVLRG